MLARVRTWYVEHGLFGSGTAGIAKPAVREGAVAPRITSVRRERERIVLRVDWPAGGEGHVDLFDVLGRRIATAVVNRASPGEHETSLPASGLERGVAFARARQDGGVATRRIVITAR